MLCERIGCQRPRCAKRTLCREHYLSLLFEERRGTECKIDGCDKKPTNRGWCCAHYKRWRRYGDATAGPGSGRPGVKRTPRGRDRYVNNGGYMLVRVGPMKYIMEHRLVMEKKLGRPLYPNERVHHKDGNRLNNKPSNLELWAHTQPSGQRVKDLLAWAREIIERYG